MNTRKVLATLWEQKDNKYLWFSVSTAIILGMIWFVDPGEFFQAMGRADLFLLIPAFFFGFLNFPVWSYVWYRVFRSSGIDVSFRKAFDIFMAGQFMNSVTPLGQFGGEPVMALLVEQNSEASYEKSLSTVFSSDIMNTIPMVTFVLGGAVYTLFLGTSGQAELQAIIQAVYIVVLTAVVGGGLVYLLWFEAGTIESIVLRLMEKLSEATGKGEKLVDTIEERLAELEESFRVIGESPRYLFNTAVVSHAGFLTQVFCFYFIMISLGFTPDIAPIYFVVVLGSLANFSPTPGGSGAYEVIMANLCVIFFSGIGMNFVTGTAVAILFRLTTFWPQIVIGYLTLNRLQNGGKK